MSQDTVRVRHLSDLYSGGSHYKDMGDWAFVFAFVWWFVPMMRVVMIDEFLLKM